MDGAGIYPLLLHNYVLIPPVLVNLYSVWNRWSVVGRYFLLSRIFFKLGQRNILFRMFWISFLVQRDSKKLTVRNIFRNGEKLSFTVNNCFWRFGVSCFREIIDFISFPYVFNIPSVTFTLISIWFTLLH